MDEKLKAFFDNLTDEQKERLDIVNNKAVRMKELVDTFYEYSLVTTSKEEMKHEKLNILNMLIDLISDCAPLMDKKGITPKIDLPGHSVYIFSDRNAIDRIRSHFNWRIEFLLWFGQYG